MRGQGALRQINARPLPFVMIEAGHAFGEGSPVRIHFIKDGKAVADREIACDQQEAVALASTMFEEGASRYDGVEVWSLTRRVYKQGRIAKPRLKAHCGMRPPTMH